MPQNNQSPPAHSPTKTRRPEKVKIGGSVARIYRLGDGTWQGSIILAGKRERWTRTRLEDARAEAERLCVLKENGRGEAAGLSGAELESYVHARARLGSDGPPVHTVVEEWLAARELAGGAGLPEIARFWATHHASGFTARTAAQARAELLAVKADVDLNARYRRALDHDLARFAAAFPARPLDSITQAEVLDWLRRLGVGWRRRNNVRDSVVTLFRFAQSQRYLPQGVPTAAEGAGKLPRPRDTPAPGVFTPEELRIILAQVRPVWLPWALLGAFAGLRAAEIERMRWERDFYWEDNLIFIGDEVAKRTSRKQGDSRHVEMPANLVAWLAPWRHADGPVCPRRSDRETGRLGALLPGAKWPQNGLRHSWVSYMSALTGNLPAVATEAGNSVEVARRHYRNPRMKREAQAWFAIYPDAGATPANVVSMSS